MSRRRFVKETFCKETFCMCVLNTGPPWYLGFNRRCGSAPVLYRSCSGQLENLSADPLTGADPEHCLKESYNFRLDRNT